MNNKKIIFTILTSGILICTSAFYLEMNQISKHSDLLIYLGGLLLLLGIVSWLAKYRKSKGRLPRPLIDFDDRIKNNSQAPDKHFAIFGYILSHFKEFIVIIFSFVTFTTLIFSLSSKSSELYMTSYDYVKKNQEINNSIGTVMKSGFLVSKQNLQNGNYKFRYNVIGEFGIVDARIILKQSNNDITIDSLYFD